jgi:hypothetical protein
MTVVGCARVSSLGQDLAVPAYVRGLLRDIGIFALGT